LWQSFCPKNVDALPFGR
jgi:hypothetical protein